MLEKQFLTQQKSENIIQTAAMLVPEVYIHYILVTLYSLSEYKA